MRIRKVLLINLTFIIYTLSVVFGKFASSNEVGSFDFIVYYSLQLLCFLIYAGFWQKLISDFNLSLVYSLKSLTIFWSLIFGYLLFNEALNLAQFFAICIIGLGLVLVYKNE